MSKETLRLVQAFSFATEKHSVQRRKGRDKSPYMNHPAEVAALVAEATGGTDVNLIIAALLHDVVEDTGTSLQEIQEKFGDDVAQIVADVSDDKALPKARRKELQVEHAGHLHQRVQILKIADKIANLRTTISDPPDGWGLERRQEYFVWSKQVVDKCRGASPCLEEKFDAIYAKGMAQLATEALRLATTKMAMV